MLAERWNADLDMNEILDMSVAMVVVIDIETNEDSKKLETKEFETGVEVAKGFETNDEANRMNLANSAIHRHKSMVKKNRQHHHHRRYGLTLN